MKSEMDLKKLIKKYDITLFREGIQTGYKKPPPEDMKKIRIYKTEIKEIIQKLNEEERRIKKERIEKSIQPVVEGEILIDFGIVGHDFKNYQAWIYDKDVESKDVQDIMTGAIKKLLEKNGIEDVYVSNSCEFIKKNGDVPFCPATEDRLPQFYMDIQRDAEEARKNGYNDTVVTSFSAKLSDILSKYITEKTKKKEDPKKKEETLDRLKILFDDDEADAGYHQACENAGIPSFLR